MQKSDFIVQVGACKKFSAFLNGWVFKKVTHRNANRRYLDDIAGVCMVLV